MEMLAQNYMVQYAIINMLGFRQVKDTYARMDEYNSKEVWSVKNAHTKLKNGDAV